MIPLELNLYCRVCKQERSFNYLGEQETLTYPLQLYNCSTCNNTQSIRYKKSRIERFIEEELDILPGEMRW